MWCFVVLLFILPCAFFQGIDFSKVISPEDFLQFESYKQRTDELEKEGKPFTLFGEKYHMYVYTQNNILGSRVSLNQSDRLTDVSSFDPKLKTVIYSHGWHNSYNDIFTGFIRTTLLKAANLNVMTVDWDFCAASLDYATSWACVQGVGKFISEFLITVSSTYNYSLSNVTLVGHSLGAHVAGYAGKYTNGAIGFIVGLDPAGPLFFRGRPETRLNATDAQYVLVIHTSSIFLGVSYDVGTADFWPNGKSIFQAGCFEEICSHARALEFYAESLTRNRFVGRRCDSFQNFQAGTCSRNPTSIMGGLNIDITARGEYYLRTNALSLYGTGTA